MESWKKAPRPSTGRAQDRAAAADAATGGVRRAVWHAIQSVAGPIAEPPGRLVRHLGAAGAEPANQIE